MKAVVAGHSGWSGSFSTKRKRGGAYDRRIDGMGRPYSRERTPVETFEELHHRSRHHPGGMWTSARDAVVIEMARSGERCEKIADELGISKSAVYKRIRRLRKAGEEI